MGTETLSAVEARRLALFRTGLLGGTARAGRTPGERRRACHEVLRRLGYLQLDTVSVAGARSHAIVLFSRLSGLDAETPERLLRPKQPLFEYWGHEASWLPIELYPVLAFRRREFAQAHPWWGGLLKEHGRKAVAIKRRIRDEGPLRSADFEDGTARSDWGFTLTKRLLHSLWSAGEIGIRERRHFHRYYDLTERVVPARWRENGLELEDAIRSLAARTLENHGWASAKTLVQNFRLGRHRKEVLRALEELREEGTVVPCAVQAGDGRTHAGWVRRTDLALVPKLKRFRPRKDRAVLLSPFDSLMWDRDRVRLLFDYDQILEVYKPASQRKYGYYCLPVLAGDEIVARCDLKARRAERRLEVLSVRYEKAETPTTREAVRSALRRHAGSLELRLEGGGRPPATQ